MSEYTVGGHARDICQHDTCPTHAECHRAGITESGSIVKILSATKHHTYLVRYSNGLEIDMHVSYLSPLSPLELLAMSAE